MLARRVTATALLALGLLLGGCGTSSTGSTGSAQVTPADDASSRTGVAADPETGSSPDPGLETAASGPAPPARPDPAGGPCPVAFTEVHEAQSSVGTTSVDQFPRSGQWWVCTYVAGRAAERRSWMQWRRTGEARPVRAEARADLLHRLVRETREPDPELPCTADLGPRLVAVHVGGPEQSRPAAVLDLFGCDDLRLLPGLDGVTLSGQDPVLRSGLDRTAYRRLAALAR